MPLIISKKLDHFEKKFRKIFDKEGNCEVVYRQFDAVELPNKRDRHTNLINIIVIDFNNL